MASDQKEKDGTYGISCTVIGEEFTALVFELGKSLERICPRRNPNRVHRIGVDEISHREVGKGSMGIAVDRVLVPSLSSWPVFGPHRQNIRENICDRV